MLFRSGFDVRMAKAVQKKTIKRPHVWLFSTQQNYFGSFKEMFHMWSEDSVVGAVGKISALQPQSPGFDQDWVRPGFDPLLCESFEPYFHQRSITQLSILPG